MQYSWNKYGENNFKFEIIDKGENYNELEKYYIRKYKSTNSRFGYNIMPGGENPPVGSHTKLSKDDILNLQNMLSNNKIPINEIYDKYDQITHGEIRKINIGRIYHNQELNYPLREPDDIIGVKTAKLIIYDLKHTSMTQKEIAHKFHISRTCVTAINIGKVNTYKYLCNQYPVRTGRHYYHI